MLKLLSVILVVLVVVGCKNSANNQEINLSNATISSDGISAWATKDGQKYKLKEFKVVMGFHKIKYALIVDNWKNGFSNDANGCYFYDSNNKLITMQKIGYADSTGITISRNEKWITSDSGTSPFGSLEVFSFPDFKKVFETGYGRELYWKDADTIVYTAISDKIIPHCKWDPNNYTYIESHNFETQESKVVRNFSVNATFSLEKRNDKIYLIEEYVEHTEDWSENKKIKKNVHELEG